MERICTKCGQPLEDDNTFCESCGTEYTVDADEKTVPADTENDAAENDVIKQTDAEKAFGSFLGKKKPKLIAAAIALVLVIAGIAAIFGITANTPESKLKKAVKCRLSGDIEGSAAIDYDANFSKDYSKDEAIAQMKANEDLKKSDYPDLKLKIKTETRLIDEEPNAGDSEEAKEQKKHLTNRIKELENSYRDTDKITDIRTFTYDLMSGKDVKKSGSAEAIKVDGKWYILGVAREPMNIA